MEPRLSFVTLGVDDVGRSRKFYEALGFKASSASQDAVAFFDAGGIVLSLFGRDALAEDVGVRSEQAWIFRRIASSQRQLGSRSRSGARLRPLRPAQNY